MSVHGMGNIDRHSIGLAHRGMGTSRRGLVGMQFDIVGQALGMIGTWAAPRRDEFGLAHGKLHLATSFDTASLVLPTLDIRLGLVVHPKSHKRKHDAKGLNGMDALGEPNNGDADDGYALNQRGD